MENTKNYLKGRGAQINTPNPYHKTEIDCGELAGIDDQSEKNEGRTTYIEEFPKKIVNKVDSPDIGPDYSVNPYQGCEHGCVYCYARNAHQYWGFSAGKDFESKIIVKKNAPELLEEYFQKKTKAYEPKPIMLSGNTDCYQPVEKKLKITRRLLQVCLKYRHPVGVLTKNAMLTRDIDIFKEMASMHLISTALSVTTLQNELHNFLEPRTAAPAKRLKTIRTLADNGIPVVAMIAPIIPGLNDHEVPDLLKATADAGALTANFTVVRLNGAIGPIFTDWIHKVYPLKADRVLARIKSVHNGKLNDSRYGLREHGDGNEAKAIHQLFAINKAKYYPNRKTIPLDCTIFRSRIDPQLSLF